MGKRESTCCFTGHRARKLPWRDREEDPRCVALKRRISDVVECAYEAGYRHFICGMAKGCDLYFCESALSLQARCLDVTVEAALPYPIQLSGRQHERQAWFRCLMADCDVKTELSRHYTRYCMLRRDQYMVDCASLLIAAFDGTPGGTAYTIRYAQQCGIQIWELPIVTDS